jgi:hypothetical protein
VRSTAPPSVGRSDPGAGWGLRRAARLAFPGSAARARNPAYAEDLAVYLTDMVRPYGLALGLAALSSAGQAYDEMGRALIERVMPEGEQVDLLVLAYAVPDIVPGRSSAVRLSRDCPGVPMAFAISDQGAAAAYTALRLLRQYAAAGEARRSLLIVLEQAWLPYHPVTPTPLPTGHSGVALLFGDEGAAREVRMARLGPIRTHTPADDSTLPAAISMLTDAPHGPGADRSVAILGPQLAAPARAEPAAGQDNVRLGFAGRPYTGAWWELVGELSRPHAEPQRLVVADYDPGSLTLCLAAFDVYAPIPVLADRHDTAEIA